MKVQLFSGGIDSIISTWYTRPDRLIYIDLKHRYSSEELQSAVKAADSLNYALTALAHPICASIERSDGFIPYRNLDLCTTVAQYFDFLGRDMEIICTVQKDEMEIPDRTLSFMQKTSELLSSLSGRTIQITTPFSDIDKVEMVRLFLEKNKPDILVDAWTCYHPVSGKPCYDCPACFRKWVALTCNGVSYEGTHIVPVSSIAYTYQHNIKKYSAERQDRMLSAFEMERYL